MNNNGKQPMSDSNNRSTQGFAPGNPYWLGNRNNEGSLENYSRVVTSLILSRAAYATNAKYCEYTLNYFKDHKHGITEFIYPINRVTYVSSHPHPHIEGVRSEHPSHTSGGPEEMRRNVIFPINSSHKYLIAHKPSTKEIYVAFCGTDGFETCMTDACILGVVNEFQGRFHSGFYQKSKLLPLAPLINFLKKHQNYKLIFTGHSLGGAIAAVTTSRLLFHEQAVDVRARVYCIGFGTPSIGDSDCSKFIDESFKECFHFYVNRDDPIPFLLSSLTHCLRDVKTNIIAFLKQLGVEIRNDIENDERRFAQNRNNEDETSSFTSDTETSQVSSSFLNRIFKTTQIDYSSLGRHFHIVSDPASGSSDSDKIVSLDEEGLKRLRAEIYDSQTQKIKWNSLTTQRQNHKIENYLREIYACINELRVINSNNSLTAEARLVLEHDPNSVLSEFLLPKKYLWTVFRRQNIQSKYLWSIKRKTREKTNEETVILQLKGPAVDFILGVKCEQSQYTENIVKPDETMSEESIKIFRLKLSFHRNPTCDNYPFLLVTHFNTIDMKGLFNPSDFESSIGLEGRKRQVAELSIIDLYTSAFSYSTFVESNMRSESDESVNIRRQKDVRKYLLRCESLFEDQLKSFEELLRIDNGTLVNNIKKELASFNGESQRKDRCSSIRNDADTQSNISLKIPSKLVKIEDVIKQWENRTITDGSSELSTVEIMHEVIPTLVSIIFSILKLPDDQLSNKVLGGTVVSVIGCLIMSGANAAYSLLGAAAGGTIGVLFAYLYDMLRETEQEYNHLLQDLARSLGIIIDQIREEPYCLEKEISEIYEKKFHYNTDYIVANREKFFSYDSFKVMQKNVLKHHIALVECIDAHFQMRRLLSEDFAVGIVGPGKTGKSKFIREMFNFNTKPGNERTVDINSYRVCDEFRIIDFPHSTSTKDLLRSAYRCHFTLINGVIVVLDGRKMADENNEKELVNTVKSLSKEGVEVLYCFNLADELIRYRPQDTTQTNRLNRFKRAATASEQDSDNGVVQQEYITTWTKEKVSETLEQFAKNYDIPLDKCIFTFAELNVTDDQWDKTCQQLVELGLKNPLYIKETWLKRFLELNTVSLSPINKITEFWDPE